MRVQDLTGKRFGRLTVISRAENKGKHLMWNCICDCGNTKTARGETLKSGETKSCGCLLSESTRNRMKTHGFGFENRLYRIWSNMKGRCYSKTSSVYNIYGARGITVCDEWKNDFLAFRKWALANGYDENAKRMDCTLDRINVDGNYCPENCRWVDIKTQANNRRTNVFITYNEETHTISEWAEITGIKPFTLASRKRKGWSDKDCIEIPPYGRPKS